MLCTFQSLEHYFDSQNPNNICGQPLFQTNKEGKPDGKAEGYENPKGLLL